MITRSNAVSAFTAASDQRGKEGYFVDAAGVIVSSAAAPPYGVIVEGLDAGQVTTVADSWGGFAGNVSVKLGATPGTVNRGTLLVLTATGVVIANDATAGNVVVAQAKESGAADELIEAVLVRPYIIGPDTIDDGSVTEGKLADDAVTTVKIADNAVTPAKLADAVSDQITSTTVVVANTGTPDGVAHVTGQVRDSEGNALAGRFLVTVWLSETSYGAPADLGDLAAAANSLILVEDVTDAMAQVRTHTDGTWGLDFNLTADGTVHAQAAVTGILATATVAITGN